MNILTIPKAWRVVYQYVQGVCPEAILGGGALRDLDNGRPVKDLDIFINDGNISLVLKALGNPEITKETGEQYFEWDPSVCNVIELAPHAEIDAPPINLIELGHSCTVEEQMRRFDFGICQIMLDAKGIHMSEAYKTDKANKTFTLTRRRSYEQREHSLRRFERLQEKYPGWTLVSPILDTSGFDLFT